MKLSKHNIYLLKIFFIIFIINCFCYFIYYEYQPIFGIRGLRRFNEGPTNSIYFRLRYDYVYIFWAYFVASLGHVFLYNRLWFFKKETAKWLNITKYIVGMYLVFFLILTIRHNLGKDFYVIYLFAFLDLGIILYIYMFIKPILFFLVIAWFSIFFLKKPVVEKI